MNRFVLKKIDFLAKVSIFLISAVFGYIAGFRPFGVGLDYLNYQSFYNELRLDDALSYFRYEPGFVFLAQQFKSFTGLNYMYFAATLVTISLIVKFSVLKRLHHPSLAIIFYLCVWFPLHENTQVRAAAAIALLFMATEKMFQRRWVHFIVFAIISATFHITAALVAIVLLSANFLANYPLKYSIPIGLIVAASASGMLATLLTLFDQLNPLFRSGDTDFVRPNPFSGTNMATIMFLMTFMFSNSHKDHRCRTFFLVACSGMVVFFLFASVPVLAHRLKEVLMVFITFIAFEYRITLKTIPQAFFATCLMVWSIYSAVSGGLFSD
jgi:hypothetical protein